MYKEFFGLERNPFRMTPDPAFLFLTPRHREALAGLTYAILDRRGFVVVIGDAGTGKTTLLQRFLEAVPEAWLQAGVILNPTLTVAEFSEAVLLSFGLTDIPASKPQRLRVLREYLQQASKSERVSALLIDEAHKLTTELLEEVRLIGNMEERGEKLLQIVLLGQNDLTETLNQENLRQLKQRISLRFTIGPLSDSETDEYLGYRWEKAGGKQPPPFTAEAIAAIKEASGGIPRAINVICDNVLTLAYARGCHTVTADHIRSVCADLDLRVSQPKTSHAAAELNHAMTFAPVPNGTAVSAALAVASGPAIETAPPATIFVGVQKPVAVDATSVRIRVPFENAVAPRRSWLQRLFGVNTPEA